MRRRIIKRKLIVIGALLAVWAIIVVLANRSDDAPPDDEDASPTGTTQSDDAGLEGRAPADAIKTSHASTTEQESIDETTGTPDRCAVKGRVVDEKHQPVAGVTIRAGLPRKPLSGPDDAPIIAESDENGMFHGWAKKDGWIYADDTHEWIADDVAAVQSDRSIILRGHRALLLRGTVLGTNGRPKADVRVSAEWSEGATQRNRWARSDAKGAFEMRVPAAQHRVTVWALPPRGDVVEGDVRSSLIARSVVDPARENPITLRFDEGAFLSGEVMRPDGTPITVGKVTAKPLDWPPIVGHWELLQGGNAFHLSGLAPGRYRLEFGGHREDEFACPPMEVRAPQAGIRMICRKVHALRGSVADTAPGPFRVSCFHRSESGTYYSVDSAQVVNGKFLLSRVPAGTYALLVRSAKSDLCAWLEDVKVPSELPPIKPKKGLRITGHIEYENFDASKLPKIRYPTVFAMRDGIRYYGTRSHAEFNIRGLQPGDYTLHWMAGAATGRFDTNGPVEAGTEGVALRVKVE